MPLTLGELIEDRREMAIPFGTECVNVTYAPGNMSPTTLIRITSLQARIAAAQKAGDATGEMEMQVMSLMVDMLAEMLIAWDILGNDREPLPCTRETVGALGMGIVMKLFAAVNGDGGRVGEPPGAVSVAGS